MESHDTEAGLLLKYNVQKVSTGEPVHDCFVLRPQKDAAARAALLAYAKATHNAKLASDLIVWVRQLELELPLAQLPDMCCRCMRSPTDDICHVCLYGGHESDIVFFMAREEAQT